MKARLAPPGARWQRRAPEKGISWTFCMVYVILMVSLYLIVSL
jgi:hypothetical protein